MRKVAHYILIFFLLVGVFSDIAYANPLLKPLIKTVVKSMVRKSSRVTTKTALQKAEERWFARFTREQLEDLNKAVQRAEPVAGKEGWLKTAIGISLWITGADLVLDVVSELTGDGTLEFLDMPVTPRVSLVSHTSDTSSVLAPLPHIGNYKTIHRLPYGFTFESYRYPIWEGHKVTYYPVLRSPKGNISKKPISPYGRDTQVTKVKIDLNLNAKESSIIIHRADPVPVDKSHPDGYRHDYDTFRFPTSEFDLSNVPHVPRSSPVPESYKDIWQEPITWVEFPDPSRFPNPDEAILQSQPVPLSRPLPMPMSQSSSQLSPPLIQRPLTHLESQPIPQLLPQQQSQPQTRVEAEGSPDRESRDWSHKFKVLVTKKFPFSLPWDVHKMFSFLLAKPVRPDIVVNQTFMGMPFTFEHKFEYLDSFIAFFRSFIVISFCLFLIYKTRSLLGGAK